MKKTLKRLAITIMAFAVAFTSLPMMAGDLSVYAASVKAPVKVTGVGKKAAGTDYITVKWTRIKNNKNTKGYTIYLNGRPVKSVGKGTLSYKVTGLSQNTSYKFQVRAYNTYKQKQYYNSKTKKWQVKKPAKKRWKGKKTRNVTKYKLGPSSAAATIKTAAKTTSGGSSNNGTSGSNGDSTTTTGNTRTVTDFLGTTRTITKHQDSSGVYWTYKDEYGNTRTFPDSQLWCYDRTMNGENATYKQQSGATFRLTGGGNGYTYGSISSPKFTMSGSYCFAAYNVDPTKLQITLTDASLEDVNTYYWNEDSQKVVNYTATYINKNGKRIGLAYAGANGRYFAYENNNLDCLFYGDQGGGIGTGIGIYNGTFCLQIVYDGVAIGTMNISTCAETLAANGMTPKRRMYYAVAETAINGNSTGTLQGDYRKIADWIEANIVNAQAYNTGYGTINRFDCIIAAGVLETWLIYNYGDAAYGFTRGTPGQPSTHRDYCLNSDSTSLLAVFFKTN